MYLLSGDSYLSQSDNPLDPQSAKEGLAQDVSDLHRGVIINAVGNVIKIAHPILLGVAIALYGQVMWGVFVSAQAALLPIGRMAMVGLDKGLLWWVPRQPEGLERLAIRPALFLVVCLTVLIATVIAFVLAPWIAEWKDVPAAETSIRWMAYGLVPMAIMDLLVSACLGRRAMGAQLVVRDVVWPLSQVLAALALYWLGYKEQGLALSFLISSGIGAIAAWYMFRRVFRGTDWPSSGDTLRGPLMKYALPMWGGEVVNSWLMRIDQIIVFAVLGPAQAGVYGVVVMVGNAVRMIRRVFDPIVTAIFSGAQAKNDEARMGANFSYATTLVIGTQMPVFAFILLFTPWILPFIGPAYDSAIVPISIVCGFWLINGALGLNGLILVGYGRSDLALLNVLIAMAYAFFMIMLVFDSDRWKWLDNFCDKILGKLK